MSSSALDWAQAASTPGPVREVFFVWKGWWWWWWWEKKSEFWFLFWRKKKKDKKKTKKKIKKKNSLTIVDERQNLLPRERPVLGHPGRVRGVEEHVVAEVRACRGDEVAEVLALAVGAAGSCFEEVF